MVAVKANRCYKITEQDMKKLVSQGYDIKDDNGNIIEYGAGKKVPIGDYIKALQKIEVLEAEVKELRKTKTEAPAEEVSEEAPAKGKKKSKK